MSRRMESKSSTGRSVSRMSVMGGLLQELVDFFVGGLRKVVIPEANRLERLGCAEADDVDALVAKFVAGLRRGDRDRDDDRARLHLAKCRDRGAHRRPGRQAVVNDDHGLLVHVDRRTRSTIFALAALQFLLFAQSDLIDYFLRNGDPSEDVAIHDADAAAGDRAHGELFMSWDA